MLWNNGPSIGLQRGRRLALAVRLAALYSGGKDSTYAIHHMQQQGHEITTLVTLYPEQEDSLLFHVPNVRLAPIGAEALGLPIITATAPFGEAEELRSLTDLLRPLSVDGVVIGAIASDFQHTRIHRVCYDLGLRVFAPLWRKDPKALLRTYLEAGFQILIVGVYAEGLGEEWLGQRLDPSSVDRLEQLEKTKGVHPAGEGGEYETFVLDGPCFSKEIRIHEGEKSFHRDSGRYEIRKVELRPHGSPDSSSRILHGAARI